MPRLYTDKELADASKGYAQNFEGGQLSNFILKMQHAVLS